MNFFHIFSPIFFFNVRRGICVPNFKHLPHFRAEIFFEETKVETRVFAQKAPIKVVPQERS